MPSQRKSTSRALVSSLSAGGVIAALAFAAAGCSAQGDSNANEVLVYDGGGAWGDAQRKAFFKPFTRETGITVVPVAGDSPAAERTAVDAGKPTMDVYDLTPQDVASWTKASLLSKINYGTWKKAKVADFHPYPVQDTAVPALIFGTQIAWNKDAVDEPLRTWSDFWDTGRFPGKRTLGDGSYMSTSVFEAALLADGVSPDHLYPLDIDRAFKKLDELRPDILRFWSSGAESLQMLVGDQVTATAAWNGRIDAAQAEDSSIKSTWNQAILTTDMWAIPSKADNAENAQKFVEFVSRPDRQAAFAKLITYAPTNAAAYKSIPADRQALLPTAPKNINVVIPSDTKFWSSDSGDGRPWSDAIVDRWQKWLAK